MPAGRPYSRDEDDFIRANYQSMSYRDIGVHLGRSETAVAHRVPKLGFSKMALRRWTIEEDEAIRSRCRTDRLEDVSRALGRRPSEVSSRAARLGVSFRKRRGLTRGGHVIIAFGPKGYPILEHRVVVEQDLGRCLRDGETVHHINTIKRDNGVGNLFLCAGPAEHQRAHRSLERLVPELLERGIIRFNRAEGIYELCATVS